MRSLDAIVKTFVRAVIRVQNELTQGGSVAAQFIGPDDPWDASAGDQPGNRLAARALKSDQERHSQYQDACCLELNP